LVGIFGVTGPLTKAYFVDCLFKNISYSDARGVIFFHTVDYDKVILERCNFSLCTGGHGGALGPSVPYIHIIRCRFENNYSPYGNDIFVHHSSSCFPSGTIDEYSCSTSSETRILCTNGGSVTFKTCGTDIVCRSI
jgi:hypothetical protein